MKKLTFCLILFAFLAFGQKSEIQKMDRNAATQAWAAISFPLPPDTPSITGGGLIVESETNGWNRKVWLTATRPGAYLLQGKTCNGDDMKLGEVYWEANYPSLPSVPSVSSSPSFGGLVFDSVALASAFPFASQMCSVEAIRLDKGKIEKSSVEVNPWQQPSPAFQFGSEGITKDGRYFVAMPLLPADAIVILGRSMIATEIQRSPTNNIVVFPQVGMPPVGPTTITVCSGGKCTTTTFERKVAVETPGGKG